ncbi:MAG: hypothetical protein LBJ86_06980 [Spirochaetaceae bacterium]|jgi:hypothetical protein|nr:hypothetical protein [Spirochaetaceae bacterium]
MSIPRIYLETTMFNFPFVPDKPGYSKLKFQTLKIFELIKVGRFLPYTSLIALQELRDTDAMERRDNMLALIREHNVTILTPNESARKLSELYVNEGAVPPGYPLDALHIALTTVNQLDFIVSLNFEHIARAWTVERVGRVNAREGYKSIGIYRPEETLKKYENL